MADNKTTGTTGGAKPAVKANLSRAGESTDPAVQSLLAELQTARLNKDDDGAGKVLDRLAELGYSAE